MTANNPPKTPSQIKPVTQTALPSLGNQPLTTSVNHPVIEFKRLAKITPGELNTSPFIS